MQKVKEYRLTSCLFCSHNLCRSVKKTRKYVYRYKYRIPGLIICGPSIIDFFFRQKGLQSPLPQFYTHQKRSHACSENTMLPMIEWSNWMMGHITEGHGAYWTSQQRRRGLGRLLATAKRPRWTVSSGEEALVCGLLAAVTRSWWIPGPVNSGAARQAQIGPRINFP